MSAEDFLTKIQAGEDALNATVVLTPSLVRFLDDVAKAKRKSRSEVLRELLYPMKAQWDTLTPAQRRGSAHE